jgi:hypothetical protein
MTTKGRERSSFGLPEDSAECCIGIGSGPIYAIGPNHTMGTR